MLVDNCAGPEGGIHLVNRGNMGSGQGWAMVDRGPLSSEGVPDGKGGRVHGAPLLSGSIESQGKPVTPQRLYLSQLAERLGPNALKNIGYTTADPMH